jgi:hypothetical protein
MLTLPVRRDPAPLAIRTTVLRTRPVAGESAAETTAAAKPPATPDDPDIIQQQQAFDQLMLAKAEQQREANVIRDMMTAQLKRDEDILKKWIEMI